ncbi:MAG: hypothetical protein ABR981_02590 [Candidatus Micrarchaeaceae archaeon]|jgi:hypothetical protein
MQNSQLLVIISTVVIFVLSLLLAISLTRKYNKTKAKSLMFWSVGLWAFSIGALLEIIFAFGVYSSSLGDFYVFIVALLVELLALGSMELIKSSKLKKLYYIFAAVTTIALVYTVIATRIGNIVTNYVASGNPPLAVLYSSSVITFMASIILVFIAVLSYKRKKDPRMLSIILGVIIVVIAGTLYIASFPVFLYYSEFVGIICLWFGFSSSKK